MSLRFGFMLPLLSAIGLSACTVSTPFRGPGVETAELPDGQAGDKVFVAMTHAVLKDDPALRDLFFDHVETVERSLAANPGFIGFSKRMRLFGNDAWTMTVWSDEKSLEAFVRNRPHRRAMIKADEAVESSRFARFEMAAGEIPPTWDEALARLELQNSGY